MFKFLKKLFTKKVVEKIVEEKVEEKKEISFEEKLKELGYCFCGAQYNQYWAGGKKPIYKGHPDDLSAIKKWNEEQLVVCEKCKNFISNKNWSEILKIL